MSTGPSRRLPTWLAPVWLGCIGALVSALLLGTVRGPVGPFEASMTLRPAWSGGTVVRLSPLGTLRLDTHDGPFALEARVEELDAEQAEAIVADPSRLAGLEDEIALDATTMVRALLLRSAVVATLGGLLLALVRRPGWRAPALGAGGGLVTAAAAAAVAVATWRSQALAEPRYTGLLKMAPAAIGNAQDINRRFDEYRGQLARLVGNLAVLYQAGERLPGTFQPDATTVRVLHVSDIHLNPQAFDLMAQVARRFDVDLIVDSGDTTDFGTTVENAALEPIGRLEVPYAWVRGNHDSATTQQAVAAHPNAVVLDGGAVDLAGLRLWGIGDPRFTPDKSAQVDKDEERARADRFAPTVAARLRDSMPPPVDVMVVHDPRTARDSGGLAPVVLAGHTHRPQRGAIGDSLLLVQGSTGGAGLRGLEGDDPSSLTCSVLYFDRATRRVVAYDLITVAGLGKTQARIERTVLGPPVVPDATEPEAPSTTGAPGSAPGPG